MHLNPNGPFIFTCNPLLHAFGNQEKVYERKTSIQFPKLKEEKKKRKKKKKATPNVCPFDDRGPVKKALYSRNFCYSICYSGINNIK